MSREAIAIRHEDDATPALHREEFVAALSSVLASQAFARSARLSAFLRHVCVTTLEGREKILCEHQIGISVFGRPEHFNPADDTIVRTTARLLRQRLAQYYEGEGQRDPVRIMIPRGAYVPVFAAAALAGATDLASASPLAAPSPDERGNVVQLQSDPAEPSFTAPAAEPAARRPLPRKAIPYALLALTILLGALGWWWSAAINGRNAADASHRFWSVMMAPDVDTLLVVADNGLVMYQGDTRREVGLSDYIANRPGAGDTAAAALSVQQYNARRYTAMSSVTLAAELGKRAIAAPDRFHVRFARDVQLADLKHGNAILVGVEQSNPWWALFRNQFNFHIDWDRTAEDFAIVNDHPASGERASYPFSWRDPGKRGYALIGFKRNLSGDGHTLLVGGTTSAGTDAAVEFLMSPASMAPLMKQATRPDGTLREFEVLLQCVLQANGSTDIQVLGLRFNTS